jgi:hypothetical protein
MVTICAQSRRLGLALLAASMPLTAAANCPLQPGKWEGFISGELVAVAPKPERTVVTTDFKAAMELDVACDGKVEGVFRSGTGIFQAFSPGPATRTGECTLGYSFHLRDGKVERGADGAPVMVLNLLVTGRIGECKGDYAELAWHYVDRRGILPFRFEAMYPRAERGFFGSTRNWEIEHNTILNLPFDATGAKYATKYLWVIFPKR